MDPVGPLVMDAETFLNATGGGSRKFRSICLRLSSTLTKVAWTPAVPVSIIGYFCYSAAVRGGVVVSLVDMTVAQFLALGAGSQTPDVLFDDSQVATRLFIQGGFDVTENDTVYVNCSAGGSAVTVILFYLT